MKNIKCLLGMHSYSQASAEVKETLTAEPIKHGRWIKTGQSFICPKKFRNYFCSVCGFELDKSIRTEYHYCPNCGARMDAQIGEDKSHPFAESVMMGMDEVEE